jgi:trigger factor
MKTEVTDVSATRKTVAIEIPIDLVDAEINRVARGYTKQARLPGFRPGKAPQALIKRRFKEQILHDVMHDLIPRAVEEAMQERGIEPVNTPDITEVVLEEGRPMTFTAAIETVPEFDPGDCASMTLERPSTDVPDEAIADMLERLRDRAGTYEPVEGRAVAEGDAVVLVLDRTGPDGQVDHHDEVTVQLGAPGNPPGFDAELIGMHHGESRTFTIQFPENYSASDLANTDQTYAVTLTGIRRRVLPDLDDEFAKDLGEFESLAALRERIAADLGREAEDKATREVRAGLLKQLAARVTFELPASLVDREMDRRLEEFARQLASQNLDPREAGIDWAQFREAQREPAQEATASALALDEIAKREGITVANEDVDKEIEGFAARAGKTPTALRAQLEKEGGIARLYAGLRREKAVDLALSRATIVDTPTADATDAQ